MMTGYRYLDFGDQWTIVLCCGNSECVDFQCVVKKVFYVLFDSTNHKSQ